MPAAIVTENLSKDYGGGRGLFDLSLVVGAGQVFGYLGPNGAGKTTSIRLLMGMIRPTRGSGAIFGLDCQRLAVDVKRRVGYLPGELPQYGGLRGKEVVAYISGLRRGDFTPRVKELAERFELDLNLRFREYSRGNKQKLGLVLAFMHRPDLLILDEPTSGLDPLNQQEFYRLVREARDAGATVFLSSHVLSEVEHICDRVGIIRRGRLIRVADLEQLHGIRHHRVEVEFEGRVDEAAVRAAAGVEDVVIENGRITCIVRGSFEPFMGAIRELRVVNFLSHEPSLEEVFLTYYGDQAEEAVPAGGLAAR